MSESHEPVSEWAVAFVERHPLTENAHIFDRIEVFLREFHVVFRADPPEFVAAERFVMALNVALHHPEWAAAVAMLNIAEYADGLVPSESAPGYVDPSWALEANTIVAALPIAIGDGARVLARAHARPEGDDGDGAE